MKTITAQPIWTDGGFKDATVIFSQVNSDNLQNTAIFYYQLYQEVDINIVPLINGIVTMTGTDYIDYNSSNDANSYVWQWLATTLGLTIIGDYVPPVPEPIAEIYVGEPSVLEVEPRSSILGELRQDAPIDEIVTK